MFPLAYSYIFTFFLNFFYQVLKEITLPTHGRLQLTVQLFIFIYYGSILSCTLWCNQNHCGQWNWHPQRDSCTTLAGLWCHEDGRSLLPSSWHISVLSRLWQAPNPLCRPWQARPQLDCSDRQTSPLTSPVYSYQYTLTVNSAVCKNSRGVPGLMCSVPR